MSASGESGTERINREEQVLAGVIQEVLDCRHRGERPELAEYVRRYPELRERIEEQFRVMDLLDGLREAGMPGSGSRGSLDPAGGLGQAISELPALIQRVIFLRHFQKLPWAQVSQATGEPEEDLRRAYAQACRQLLLRCSDASGA